MVGVGDLHTNVFNIINSIPYYYLYGGVIQQLTTVVFKQT